MIGTLSSICASNGKIIGLKDRESGAMGVIRIHGTFGWTIEPLDEREYAVDPVGVAKIRLDVNKWCCWENKRTHRPQHR